MPIKHLVYMRPNLLDGEYVEQDPVDPMQLRLIIPLQFKTGQGRTKIIGGGNPKSKPDITLIKALRAAHSMVERDYTKMPILKSAPSSPWQRKLVRLAFLAPDLQKAILSGNQPEDLTLAKLMDGKMPVSWEKQRKWLGSPQPE